MLKPLQINRSNVDAYREGTMKVNLDDILKLQQQIQDGLKVDKKSPHIAGFFILVLIKHVRSLLRYLDQGRYTSLQDRFEYLVVPLHLTT